MSKLSNEERTGVSSENGVQYKYITPFKPLPWQIPAWKSKAQVLVLAGSVGTGKSHLAANKIHGFLLHYPNATGLILRKTRAASMNSTVAFMQRNVIGEHPGIKWRPSLYRFEYPNGSMLIFGGMKDADQREHIRSIGQKGGLEIAWMEEAVQFTEEDYNEVLGRMRGTAAPWRQLILSTNPGGPNHWIHQNLIIPGYNDDNIDIYQPPLEANTYNPPEYFERLEGLTGVQRERLLYGKWVQEEGVIFDNWVDDPTLEEDSNVRYDADFIPGAGPVEWWIDDGITGQIVNGMWTVNSHPRAIMFVQKHGDGTVTVFDESYKAGIIASEHIAQMIEYSFQKGYPQPNRVVRDRAAASLGMALRNFGIKDLYNNVKIEESIKEMRNFIANSETTARLLICHPRCKFFRGEMMSYARSSKTGRIIKAHDHGVDAIRYGIWNEVFGEPADVDVAAYDMVQGDIYSAKINRVDEAGTFGIDIATYSSIQ